MSQDKLFIPKAILIAIAIISLGVALGVIFYSLSLNKSAPVAVAPTLAPTPEPTEPTESPAPSLSPEPTGEVDTSDWLSYRNEEYGFEMKYPSELSFKIIQGYVGPGVPGGDYDYAAVAIHFTLATEDPAYLDNPSKDQMPIFTVLIYTKKQWEEFGKQDYQESLNLSKDKVYLLGESSELIYMSDNHLYELRVPSDFYHRSSIINLILKTFDFTKK